MSFYVIKSKLSNFVLDCEGGGNKNGAKVIPWDKHGHDNQLWYDDHFTGTIRSKAGNLCLDIENGQLVVKQFQPGDANQQWYRDAQFIRNKTDSNKVLDVLESNKEKGAKIGAWKFNGGPNQSWEFENTGGQAPVTGGGRKFFIVSEKNGKVLDISGANKNAGAKVCTYHKNNPPSDNQLFYTNANGQILSMLNHMAFSNASKGQELTMNAVSADPRSTWRLEGKKIVNGVGECLDIKGDKDHDAAELCSYDYKDAANQHWRFEYV